MTITEAKNYLSEKIKTIYDNREAAVITDWVLEEITGFTKTERLIHKEKGLSLSQVNILKKYTEDLMQHRPVQYVLGYSGFMKMKFFVDENVLIPRPETEELVDWILQMVEGKQNLKILDVGTGSGVIPVSLKKYSPMMQLTAIDISDNALRIAKNNAVENQVEVEFIQTDILEEKAPDKLSFFDIIISNPPYVLKGEQKEMDEHVLRFEPHIALFVPDEKPLLFYEAVTQFATGHLNDNGLLFFEINENFGEEIVCLLQKNHFLDIELKRDLQGKNRMVKALFKK